MARFALISQLHLSQLWFPHLCLEWVFSVHVIYSPLHSRFIQPTAYLASSIDLELNMSETELLTPPSNLFFPHLPYLGKRHNQHPLTCSHRKPRRFQHYFFSPTTYLVYHQVLHSVSNSCIKTTLVVLSYLLYLCPRTIIYFLYYGNYF